MSWNVYEDTGELVSKYAAGSERAYNTNEVETGADFGVQRMKPVVAYSAHGATYAKSDVLYMRTSL